MQDAFVTTKFWQPTKVLLGIASEFEQKSMSALMDELVRSQIKKIMPAHADVLLAQFAPPENRHP